MTIQELIFDDAAQWQRKAGADASVIQALVEAMPALPIDYLEFLSACNGGAGELAFDPGWFQLWPAEEVASQNAGYGVTELLPGFLAFGSNGGGEMLAFDAAGAVYAVPFIPMSVAEAQRIAPNFLDLVRAFGHVPPAV